MSSSSKPSRVTLLTQLNSYANPMVENDDNSGSGGSANKALKACWWELTKARQMKSSKLMPIDVPFTACNVREEFNAKTRIDIIVPDLIDEDNNNDKDTISSSSSPPSFQVLDAVEEYKKNRRDDNDESKTSSTPSNKSSGGGLRQRKGGDKVSMATTSSTSDDDEYRSNSPSGWVVVNENDQPNDDDDENISIMKQLNIVEPIELIAGGLPPRELKRAQKQAQEALIKYIEAANKAAIVLSSLSKLQQ